MDIFTWMSKRKQVVLEAIFVTIIWVLWSYNNGTVFDPNKLRKNQNFERIFVSCLIIFGRSKFFLLKNIVVLFNIKHTIDGVSSGCFTRF